MYSGDIWIACENGILRLRNSGLQEMFRELGLVSWKLWRGERKGLSTIEIGGRLERILERTESRKIRVGWRLERLSLNC